MFSTSHSNVYRRGKHPDFVSLDGAPGMFIANSLSPQVSSGGCSRSVNALTHLLLAAACVQAP